VGISGILFLVETDDSGWVVQRERGVGDCPLPAGRPKLLRVLPLPAANDSEAILNILLNRGARRTLSQLFRSVVPARRYREVELHSRECPRPGLRLLFFTGPHS
jgi:hypothetical protein